MKETYSPHTDFIDDETKWTNDCISDKSLWNIWNSTFANGIDCNWQNHSIYLGVTLSFGRLMIFNVVYYVVAKPRSHLILFTDLRLNEW